MLLLRQGSVNIQLLNLSVFGNLLRQKLDALKHGAVGLPVIDSQLSDVSDEKGGRPWVTLC
jgi:hypothetical protein